MEAEIERLYQIVEEQSGEIKALNETIIILSKSVLELEKKLEVFKKAVI